MKNFKGLSRFKLVWAGVGLQLILVGCGSEANPPEESTSSSLSVSSVAMSSSSVPSSSSPSFSSNSSSSSSNRSEASVTALRVNADDRAFCGVLGTVENTNGGATGVGYTNSLSQIGADASWLLNVPQTGQYQLTWRYANGGSGPREARLEHNHADLTNLGFSASGDWSQWVTESVSVTLIEGANHLRLVARRSGGLANIDWLEVTGPAAVTMANCANYAPSAGLSWRAPTFRDQSVHDPSVIRVDDTFYVFGSHLAAAKSDDLMNWTRVANNVNANNPLFDDVVTELREALTWAETDTLWAPDVVRLDNGRYYMYYNACRGDSPLSALGIASASHVEGPYRDEGIILRSGMWNQISEDGTIYNASRHPNVVDPHTFYDKNRNLWMIYGSYSGGIFIMEMNPATGFPVPGQGYGRHLMGGNHARIEGAYVLYSPVSDYYYMFISFGGLDANGAYNMRVVRSRNPDGPYLDAQGNDMRTVRANPSRPLFDDATIEPYGVKLMGNHVFSGTNNQLGYVSPGHNSAYYDAETDQYFLIFHTRFPGRGELHQVRVHEMLLNSEGWPVVSPLRYAPRTAQNSGLPQPALDYVGQVEIPGSYQVINHGKDISATIKQSQAVTLHSDGRVSGALSGRWSYRSSNHVTLHMGQGEFHGVLSRQWNQHAQAFQVTFSALSEQGEALWGVRTGG